MQIAVFEAVSHNQQGQLGNAYLPQHMLLAQCELFLGHYRCDSTHLTRGLRACRGTTHGSSMLEVQLLYNLGELTHTHTHSTHTCMHTLHTHMHAHTPHTPHAGHMLAFTYTQLLHIPIYLPHCYTCVCFLNQVFVIWYTCV